VIGHTEADGPEGHFEGLNLRLYNPQSHQWSLNFANTNDGTVGEFKNGRAIFVRFVISDITADSCRFEQAFSGRWRQDLGSELDRDRHPGEKSI
jgi:hypothetical protein